MKNYIMMENGKQRYFCCILFWKAYFPAANECTRWSFVWCLATRRHHEDNLESTCVGYNNNNKRIYLQRFDFNKRTRYNALTLHDVDESLNNNHLNHVMAFNQPMPSIFPNT